MNLPKTTIHIFGNGETQINSPELSTKNKTANLTKVQPLLDELWKKHPTTVSPTPEKFHVVNIFNGNDFRWIQKDEGFIFKDTQNVLSGLVEQLIDELREKKA